MADDRVPMLPKLLRDVLVILGRLPDVIKGEYASSQQDALIRKLECSEAVRTIENTLGELDAVHKCQDTTIEVAIASVIVAMSSLSGCKKEATVRELGNLRTATIAVQRAVNASPLVEHQGDAARNEVIAFLGACIDETKAEVKRVDTSDFTDATKAQRKREIDDANVLQTASILKGKVVQNENEDEAQKGVTIPEFAVLYARLKATRAFLARSKMSDDAKHFGDLLRSLDGLWPSIFIIAESRGDRRDIANLTADFMASTINEGVDS